MKKIVSILGLIAILTSCNRGINHSNGKIDHLKPVAAVERMHDGSFFGDITGLTILNNKSILCIDSKTNKVNILSFDLTPQKSFGSFGKGPGELNYPMSVWTNREEIFIFDLSGYVKRYNLEGNIISQIKLPIKMFGDRFTGVENKIIYGGFGTNGPHIRLNIDTGEVKEFGEIEVTKNGDKSYALSSNIVQQGDHLVYTINTANAFVNVFDEHENSKIRLQVPAIGAIQRRLEFAKRLYTQSNYSPQISVDCIDDAYISRGHLYLLIVDQVTEDRASCDVVLDLLIHKDYLKLFNCYQLSSTDERSWYSSICVDESNSFLWAYEVTSHQIQKFRIQ